MPDACDDCTKSDLGLRPTEDFDFFLEGLLGFMSLSRDELELTLKLYRLSEAFMWKLDGTIKA